MSSWIEREATEIEERDRQIVRSRDWALYNAARLRDNRLPLWTAILKQVRSDVEAFNRRFPHDKQRQLELSEMDSAFTVAKVSPLPYSATATINADGSMIEIATKELRNQFCGGTPVEQKAWMALSLDEAGNTLFRYSEGKRILTFEDVSIALIKPIIESMKI